MRARKWKHIIESRVALPNLQLAHSPGLVSRRIMGSRRWMPSAQQPGCELTTVAAHWRVSVGDGKGTRSAPNLLEAACPLGRVFHIERDNLRCRFTIANNKTNTNKKGGNTNKNRPTTLIRRRGITLLRPERLDRKLSNFQLVSSRGRDSQSARHRACCDIAWSPVS